MRERLDQMRASLEQLAIREPAAKTAPVAHESEVAGVRDVYRRAARERDAQQRRFAKEGSRPSLSPVARELVPWLTGAVEYAERYGTLAQEARRWRLGFFVAAAALLAAVVGLVVIATSVKVVPYVVQVDRHGYAVAIGPAEKAAPVDERVVMASVARFFRSLRTVLADSIAQRGLLEEAFVMVGANTPAARKASDFLKARELAPQETIEVEILRVAPMKSGTSLTIEWLERSRKAGSLERTVRYSALASVSVNPTRALKDVLVNPLGVFITDFSVSQL